jgi:hemerythrin
MPKYREHVLEHQRFIYKLHDFNKQFNEENSDLTLEVVSFLRRWLLDHIQNVDAEYGAFILKRSAPR